MFFCKSKNHVWSSKADAKKCCNGYERVVVFGKSIPEGETRVKVDKASGVRYSRVWVKQKESMSIFQ